MCDVGSREGGGWKVAWRHTRHICDKAWSEHYSFTWNLHVGLCWLPYTIVTTEIISIGLYQDFDIGLLCSLLQLCQIQKKCVVFETHIDLYAALQTACRPIRKKGKSLWRHIWGVQSSVTKRDKRRGERSYFSLKLRHLWTTPFKKEIWAKAHETHESLWQFLFAGNLGLSSSISSKFTLLQPKIAKKSHNINIFKVQGHSRS